MNSACKPVSGMLPLTQPVFGNEAQSGEGLVEPVIVLRPEKRSEAPPNDVGKTSQANKVKDPEERNALEKPKPCVSW
jgi:hypothetical protein